MTGDIEIPPKVYEATGDEAVWQAARVRQRLLEEMQGDSQVIPLRPRKVNRPVLWIGLAAAIVLGIFGIKYLPGLSGVPARTYATNVGERANITLDDGTQVVLAPATTIRVSGRDVELAGEAVFTVNQHAGDPFTVKARGVVTRVLGTTFGVRAYSYVKVVVQDGKVAVDKNILSAGEAAIIAGDRVSLGSKVDVATLLSWTTGRIEFRDTPAMDLLDQLSHWYGLKFVAANPNLAARLVTGRFTTESREEVMRGLELLLDVKATVKGDVVTLR